MGKPQTLACHRFPASFGTMGSVLNAFHPDATASARGLKTWLFSVFRPALAQWAVFYRLSIRTCGRPQTLPGGVRFTGSARGLKTSLFTVRAGFGTLGCVLTAFNPDVWPPSNPPRQGTAAAGCRLWHNGLCFNGFQSGRLAALKPSLAGYGCIRQPLPLLGASTGTVRLPLALLGASKLGFSPFPAGSGTMGCVLTAFNPDVWPPSNPPQGTAATGCRLWHNGLFFTGFQSGRLAALKPSPAGYGCHWLC